MARFEQAQRDFGDLHATINTTLLVSAETLINAPRPVGIEPTYTNLKFAILPLNYGPYRDNEFITLLYL